MIPIEGIGTVFCDDGELSFSTKTGEVTFADEPYKMITRIDLSSLIGTGPYRQPEVAYWYVVWFKGQQVEEYAPKENADETTCPF